MNVVLEIMSFVTLNYTKGWRVGESSGPALDPPEFEDAVKRTVRDLCFYPPRIQIPTEASAIQSALNHFFMWSHTDYGHPMKAYEKLGRCGRQNMLWPYLKFWD
jgi:hypothetical protein